jgi:hypothetical protein
MVLVAGWSITEFGSGRRQPATTRLSAVLALEPDGPLGPGPLGDVNGDDIPDLAFHSSQAGVGFLVFGTATPSPEQPSKPDVRLETTDRTTLSVAAAQDYDGDGLRDLLLATLAKEPESFRRTGASYIVRGRRAWPATLRLPADADVTFAYRQASDIRVDACPSDRLIDLNGDGLAEVVLGAADYTPHGRASAGGAFVFFGRRAWPAALDLERDADVVVSGSRMGEGLTGHCEGGDFNGDGRQDLALLATESTLWYMLEGRGRYYVLYGRDRWPAAIDTAAGVDVRVDGERLKTVNARPVLADVNGDGLDDLAMILTHDLPNSESAPEIAIVFGRRNVQPIIRKRPDADVILAGDAEIARLGPSAPALDLDDDGSDDIVLSLRRIGACAVLRGRPAWPRRAALRDVVSEDRCQLPPGHREGDLRLGDAGGDGSPDLLTTGPANPEGDGQYNRPWTTALHVPVPVDVRPGREPNVLYLPGILVVSVDETSLPPGDEIDPGTTRVAGVASTRSLRVDEGGRRTLQLYFDTARMRVTAQTTHVTLTARTKTGRFVRGQDRVVVMAGANVSTRDGRDR